MNSIVMELRGGEREKHPHPLLVPHPAIKLLCCISSFLRLANSLSFFGKGMMDGYGEVCK